jgi:predicted O-linked N-acetylglucosamine transferase (SPINDLY family)
MSQAARDKFMATMQLYQSGQLADADKAVRRALATAPKDTNYLHLGGLVAEAEGKLPRAIMLLRQAHALRPDLADITFNLARILSKHGDHDAAIQLQQQLTTTHPQQPRFWEALAKFHALAGQIPASQTAWQRALRLMPDNADWRGQYLMQQRQLCVWDHEPADLSQLTPQALTILSDDPAAKLASAKAWAQEKFSNIQPLVVAPPYQHDRIRVGYLSSDFHNHATAYLLAELFALHDRTKFDSYIYSYGADDDSAIRQRIAATADHWRDIGQLTHPQAAQRIRQDEIDILIDLKGYTRGGRLEILAYRPAPVQAHWLGFPGTLGTGFVDYLLADAVTIPPDHEHYYSEAIIRLPDSYQINDRQRVIGAPLSRQDYGLPETGLVLASFNQSYKITPEIFAVWCTLLRQMPDSCLWLLASNAAAPENLRHAAVAHGIDPMRLIFADQKPLAEHLARYAHVDLALDTFPVVGHTTTSDALWCGTPVVALLGQSFVSRVSASLLQACGLAELITTTLPDYQTLALAMAHDTARRQRIRQQLQNRTALPLFDTPRFVRNFEAALLQLRKLC